MDQQPSPDYTQTPLSSQLKPSIENNTTSASKNYLKRNLLFVLVSLIGLLMVGILGGWYLFNFPETQEVTSVIISEVEEKSAPTPNPEEDKTVVSTDNQPGYFVYAVYENQAINIYAVYINTKQKSLIVSKETEKEFTHLVNPGLYLRAQVSPDGTKLAYRWNPAEGMTAGAPSTLYTISLDGSQRELVSDNVTGFIWSPDSQQILLSVSDPTPMATPTDYVVEAPMYGPGNDWFIYNLLSNDRTQLNMDEQEFTSVVAWPNQNQIFFVASSAYGLDPLKFVYNPQTFQTQELFISDDKSMRIPESIPSQSDYLVSLYNPDQLEFMQNPFCEIARLNQDFSFSEVILSQEGYTCSLLDWRSDNQFYYQTRVDLQNDPQKQICENGLYLLTDLHLFNLETGEDKTLIQSSCDTFRYLEDVVDQTDLIIMEREYVDEEIYRFVKYSVDDLTPEVLVTSSQEIMYIGSTQ